MPNTPVKPFPPVVPSVNPPDNGTTQPACLGPLNELTSDTASLTSEVLSDQGDHASVPSKQPQGNARDGKSPPRKRYYQSVVHMITGCIGQKRRRPKGGGPALRRSNSCFPDTRLIDAMKNMARRVLRRKSRWWRRRCLSSSLESFMNELIDAMLPALELFEIAMLAAQTDEGSADAHIDVLERAVGRLMDAKECTFFVKTEDQGLVAIRDYGNTLVEVPPALAEASAESGDISCDGQRISAPIDKLLSDNLGVVYCEREDGPDFKEEDVGMLTQAVEICSPAMVALLKARAASGATGLSSCERAGADIFQKLADGEVHLTTLLRQANDAVSNALRCEQASIYLHSKSKGKLIPYNSGVYFVQGEAKDSNGRSMVRKSSRVLGDVNLTSPRSNADADANDVKSPRVQEVGEDEDPHSDDIVGQAFLNNKAVVEPAEESVQVPGALATAPPPTSLLCADEYSAIATPLRDAQGNALGVLKAWNPQNGGTFKEHDKQDMGKLAAQVSFLINYTDMLKDLRHERNFSEATLDFMTNGIITVGHDRQVLKANAAALRILGKAPTVELAGFPVKELFDCPGDVAEALTNALDRNQTEVLSDRGIVVSRVHDDIADDDSPAASSRVNLTVAPLMRLQRILEAYGSQMKSSAKNLNKGGLESQMKDGTMRLQCGSDLTRIVDVVLLRIVNPWGEVLSEYSRTEDSTKETVCDTRLPAVLKRDGESVRAAAERCISNKVPPEMRSLVKICDNVTHEYLTQFEESKSYAGLRTQYNKTFLQATVEVPENNVSLKEQLALSDRRPSPEKEKEQERENALAKPEHRVSILSSTSRHGESRHANGPGGPRRSAVLSHSTGFTSAWNGFVFEFRWLAVQACESMGLAVHGAVDQASANMAAGVVQGKQADSEKLGAILVLEDLSREKKVLDVMSRYIQPDLAKKLINEDAGALGGRLQEATVLFSDIRSFTSFTEVLGASETVSMLNEYFGEMVGCVTERAGIVDKFIGDAIMAVWGAPFSSDDDADRAVESAVSMLDRLEVLNAARAARGTFPLKIGIGINSATVISGNIGSSQRMDYTVIGDGVNLASRLEAVTKQYGVSLLISDSTRSQLKREHRLRWIDVITVKGKTEPSPVWEPVSAGVSDTGIELFNEGVRQYREGSFASASDWFQAALGEMPDDGPSTVYIERCKTLLEQGAPDDWDGVFRMTTK